MPAVPPVRVWVAMQLGAIFDMDGVLVDSNDAHFQAFRRIGAELGRDFSDAELQQTFGMHNNQIFPLLLKEALTQQRIEQLADQKEHYYRELARTSLQPIPGALALFAALRSAGWKVAIGSSGPARNVRLAIEVLGIGAELDAVVTGDDIHHGKPAPDVFLLCLERLGLPAAQCVVLEDAPQGVTAALAANIPAVALTSSRPAALLGHAQLVVDHLAALDPPRLAQIIAAGCLPN